MRTRARTGRRIGAVLLCLCGMVMLGGCSAVSRELHITAYFSSASGVFEGNDVGILGVTVGHITSITPEGDRVRIEMSVDAGQAVPTGAHAVVVPRSVATDRYVELTPVYDGGQRMHDGAVIPLSRTSVPVDFDKVLGTLNAFATDVAGSKRTRDAIGSFLSTASTTLRGKGGLVNRTLRSLASATDSLSAQRRVGEATLGSLDDLTSKLAAHQRTIRAFVDQVGRASDLLAAERGDFRRALVGSTRMIQVVARFARRHRAQISRAVRQTDKVMGTVLDKHGRVAEILRETPLAMQNLMRTLNDKEQLRVRLDFTKLLPVLDKVFGVVCLLPSLGAPLCDNLGLDPRNISRGLQQLFGPGAGR